MAAVKSKSLSGARLKALRKSQGLSQDEVGEVINLSGRMVSNIERGLRDLTDDEVAKIESEYNISLASFDAIDQPVDLESHRPLLTEREFFKAQQTFLESKPEGSYDLWFLKPDSLPMLQSDSVIETWSKNLLRGFDYRTIWLLDTTPVGKLSLFLRRAETIGKMLRATWKPDRESKVGRIHIYGIHGLVRSDGGRDLNVKAYNQVYDGLKDTPKDKSSESRLLGEVIEVHRCIGKGDIKDSRKGGGTGGDIVALINKFYFESASVVAYVPRDPLDGKGVVVLELDEVSGFFHDRAFPGYVVLGNNAASGLIQHLTSFDQFVRDASGKHATAATTSPARPDRQAKTSGNTRLTKES